MTTALLGVVVGVAFCALVMRSSARRRRRRLREAVHELRRPLAAFLLAAQPGPRADSLREQIQVALADLDVAMEGSIRAPRVRERFTLAGLLNEARRRWHGEGVRIELGDPEVALAADRVHLGMALDNLIANGLEHGVGEVRVDARRVGSACRLEVSNATPPFMPARTADRARGHGLRIVSRELEREGGRLLAPRRAGSDVVAALELPTAPTEP
jgi:signal transduction histidine kinase